MTDPRDLIQRLADELEKLDDHYSAQLFDLLDEARAYLAQPEPEGPTDEEILALSGKYFIYRGDSMGDRFIPISIGPSFELSQQMVDFARAILACYGHQRPTPLSLTERQPTEADCDAKGRCWWGRSSDEMCNPDWFLASRAEVEKFCDGWPPSVFLPHWALPTPNPTSETH
jgi:hypothetical protein